VDQSSNKGQTLPSSSILSVAVGRNIKEENGEFSRPFWESNGIDYMCFL
jgi:hypothetical protein